MSAPTDPAAQNPVRICPPTRSTATPPPFSHSIERSSDVTRSDRKRNTAPPVPGRGSNHASRRTRRPKAYSESVTDSGLGRTSRGRRERAKITVSAVGSRRRHTRRSAARWSGGLEGETSRRLDRSSHLRSHTRHTAQPVPSIPRPGCLVERLRTCPSRSDFPGSLTRQPTGAGRGSDARPEPTTVILLPS